MVCVLVGLLLIALWVHSYSSEDYVYFPLTSDRMVTIHSTANRLRTSTYSLANVQNNPVWQSGIILKGWGRMTFNGQQISSPSRMFGMGSDFSSAWIKVPYWFPIVLSFAVAAIPWANSDSASARYSSPQRWRPQRSALSYGPTASKLSTLGPTD
jgi:hypothetical protein